MGEKHGGSESVVFDQLEKLFPPWTVTRDFWQAALRPDVSGVAVDVQLFHDSRCRLVHKYRVFRGTFRHPALRGKVMNRLLGVVSRAMDIDKLMDLHISIPALGSGMQAVPESCFPYVRFVPLLVSRCWSVRGQALWSSPVHSEPAPMDIQLHQPVCTLPPEEDSMDASPVVVKPDVS